MPSVWHVAALAALLYLVRKRVGTPGGLMSQYYKAPSGKCMFAPVGQPHYEIPCAEWELGRAAEEQEFLQGGS